DIVAAVPGGRTTMFSLPRLPPLSSLEPLIAALAAACRDGDAAALEELALAFAGAVVTTQCGAGRTRPPSPRVERRVSAAVRRIERDGQDAMSTRCSLAALSREAAMSPYHFLRVFRRVVGMTPHQYVLHMRMHGAAVRLRRSDEPISTIALDAG